jgi:hypothetical protein
MSTVLRATRLFIKRFIVITFKTFLRITLHVSPDMAIIMCFRLSFDAKCCVLVAVTTHITQKQEQPITNECPRAQKGANANNSGFHPEVRKYILWDK